MTGNVCTFFCFAIAEPAFSLTAHSIEPLPLAAGSRIALGAFLLIPAAYSEQVWIVLVAAPVFGAGYGLAMVSGLATAQALATPDDLAGITAAYYSLTYVGFLPSGPCCSGLVRAMWIVLGATAAACALCTAIAARGMRRAIALVSAF